MPDTTLVVRADAPIGTISPRLYGHFAEHLGRCCYEGLWVGTDRPDIPQQEGFRSDVLAALRALPVPLLRWPGGCYADHYHWRDGIGPPAAPAGWGCPVVSRWRTTTAWAPMNSSGCVPRSALSHTWPATWRPA